MTDLSGTQIHKPVMAREILEALAPADGATYVDGTFGAGGTTTASWYIDANQSLTDQIPSPLPDPGNLDQQTIDNLQQLVYRSSYYNSTTNFPPDYEEAPHTDDPYGRAIWYSEQNGRSFVGFTESLASMTTQAQGRVDFKVVPLGDGTTRPLFYADVIGINPATAHRRFSSPI